MNMRIHFMHGIGAQVVAGPETGRTSDKILEKTLLTGYQVVL